VDFPAEIVECPMAFMVETNPDNPLMSIFGKNNLVTNLTRRQEDRARNHFHVNSFDNFSPFTLHNATFTLHNATCTMHNAPCNKHPTQST
jgi:hypothetical protein